MNICSFSQRLPGTAARYLNPKGIKKKNNPRTAALGISSFKIKERRETGFSSKCRWNSVEISAFVSTEDDQKIFPEINTSELASELASAHPSL